MDVRACVVKLTVVSVSLTDNVLKLASCDVKVVVNVAAWATI